MAKGFTVGVVAFCTLVLELCISRLSVFYLDYSSSYVAIPLALLGLGIGSLYVHLRKKGIEGINIQRELYLFFIVSFVSFAVVFFVYSSVFEFKRGLFIYQQAELYIRTLVFILIFLPPFYYGGKILTVLFTQEKDNIGKIYAADLAAAALAGLLTPIMFHFLDLPFIVFMYFLVLVACIVVNIDDEKKKIISAVVLFPLSLLVTMILVYFESGYDVKRLVFAPGGGSATELVHRWNEFSRVSLVRVFDANGGIYSHRIIHDNAESNVVVQRFTDEYPKYNERFLTYMPYIIDSSPKDTLVMFAGGGAQMIDFYHFNKKKGKVVGVEINPLVKEFSAHESIADHRIKDFYELPNVTLNIQEGRQFLIHDENKYDMIYVASDAATSTYKTGHSRKYLDTREAMELYYSKLNNYGMIFFQSKPSWPKMRIWRDIYEREGLDFANSILVLSEHTYSDTNVWHHILLKKSPFTSEEVDKILNHYAGLHVLYAPFRPERSSPEYTEFLLSDKPTNVPVFYTLHPEDDKPYYNRLDLNGFEFAPDQSMFKSPLAIVSWMKIQTLLLIIGLTVLIFIIMMFVGRKNAPPAPVFVYLLISGFCYMLCQIVFIGKLELFLENPLYSMAVLISVFLFTNSAGSWLADRLGESNIKHWYIYFPLGTAVITLICLGLTVLAINHLIHIPLVLKIIIVIAIISPVGLCLGIFYPFAVKWLVSAGHERSVPVTYGMSTLSSVLGATFAMTIIINLGYNAVLMQAVVGYIGLAVLLWLFSLRKGSGLSAVTGR